MIETTDFVEKEKAVNSILSTTLKSKSTKTTNISEKTPEGPTTIETEAADTLVENIQNSIASETEKTARKNINSKNSDNLENYKNENSPENLENSPENLENSSSEPQTIKIEDANTTNCLALTIQKDHKLVAIKNVFFRSIRMSWKVIVSTIALGILKLFS